MYSCDKYLLSAYDGYGVGWGAILDFSSEKSILHFTLKPYPAIIVKAHLFEHIYAFFHYFTISFIYLSQQSLRENSHRKYSTGRFFYLANFEGKYFSAFIGFKGKKNHCI